MTDREAAVEFEQMAAGYGRRRVLQDVTLRVPLAGVTVLLGENGEGKTTLLRVALGEIPVRAGRARLLGSDPVREAPRLRARLGFVPAQPDGYGWMTARDLLRFLAPHYPTFDPRRAEALLARLRVPERARLRSMSRGEGMKTMLVAALAHDPEVLLLDEPFAGLDPLVRDEVLAEVIAAASERARTVLVATHDLDVAARIADRIAVLRDGRIVREGPVADFAPTSAEAPTPESLRATLEAVALEA